MVESFWLSLIVGTVLGFLSGLGTGGGSLLILWLTLVLDKPQEEARLLNLMFFIPAALISSLFRKKQGNLNLKQIWPAILAGCAAALTGSLLLSGMDTGILKKGFGILLLATGIRELFYRQRKPK